MSNNTYYPQTTEGRSEWWSNIKEEAPAILAALGFPPAEVTAIGNDADWAIYIYRTLRQKYEKYFQSVTAYGNTIAQGIGNTEGQSLPPAPQPPGWPEPPLNAIECDFEGRRENWVQRVKNSALYTESIGQTLRLIGTATPFDPTTYAAELLGMMSQSPKTVSGKFRKAYGNVDGINLFGRKDGTSSWVDLGRFNATPFTAAVPLASTAPELWEFQARAFRKDTPFGNLSAIRSLIING